LNVIRRRVTPQEWTYPMSGRLNNTIGIVSPLAWFMLGIQVQMKSFRPDCLLRGGEQTESVH